MIGLIELVDAGERLLDLQPSAIDFLRIADDAGNRPESAGDPHGARIGEDRQPPVEHARIELIGLAVQIEIGTRKTGADQWRAMLHHAGKQLST